MADNKNLPVDINYRLQEAVDELPLPPPDHVAANIPPFWLYGERECGDHRHSTSNISSNRSSSSSDHDEAIIRWRTACTNCHTRATLNQLHDLPCGDLICRECLLVKALSVKLHIDANHRKIMEARREMQSIDLCLIRAHGRSTTTTTSSSSSSSSMAPARRRALRLRYSRLRASVLRMAGLACCGMDMDLGRFLPCLGPDRARELWLALQWLWDGSGRGSGSGSPSELRACGWPDCGAFVPVSCSYVPPGDWARRWYCVTCRGNSMDCARDLAAPLTRFPFLPKGQPALTPAR